MKSLLCIHLRPEAICMHSFTDNRQRIRPHQIVVRNDKIRISSALGKSTVLISYGGPASATASFISDIARIYYIGRSQLDTKSNH